MLLPPTTAPEDENRAKPGAERPVALDLFAGVGGFALGFEQAGFDVPAALEWDPIHAATHSYDFPWTEIVCADASTVTAETLRHAVERGLVSHGRSRWDWEIDAVFGGPPCQGFSAGGKRAARDERNLLVFDFLRLTLDLRPRYFVLENVPPLKTFADPDHRDTRLLDRLISAFEAEGYRVLPPRILNASHHGVPQDRRRLIVIGAREDQDLPSYPAPSVRPMPKRSRDARAEAARATDGDLLLSTGPTVWDAIADVPDLDSFEELWHTDEVLLSEERLAEGEAAASDYARCLRGLDADPADCSYTRTWDRRLLTSSARTAHELASIRRFAETTQGTSEPRSRFYRLDPNGLCSTLRAGTGYDRGAFMAPRPIHPVSNRVISVREAARLHSFPDWFRFHATKWHGFRQIGNALPPLLGRAIGAEIMRALERAPTKPRATQEVGDATLIGLSTSEAAKRLSVDVDSVPSHKQRTRHTRAQAPEREPLVA